MLQDKLQIIPYGDYSKEINFSCGNKELDDFINTDEVKTYETEMWGKTSLVLMNEKLVAFFTLANTVIRNEWIKERVNHRPRLRQISQIPALLIGRLAVQKEFQHQGIGSYLLKIIVGKALEMSKTVGIRLVVLTAYPENINWYGDRGFQMCVEKHLQISKSEYRKKPFMYLDLKQLQQDCCSSIKPKPPPCNSKSKNR